MAEYRCTYLQSRNRDAAIEKRRGHGRWGEGEGRMNWEGSIDIYTLIFV